MKITKGLAHTLREEAIDYSKERENWTLTFGLEVLSSLLPIRHFIIFSITTIWA